MGRSLLGWLAISQPFRTACLRRTLLRQTTGRRLSVSSYPDRFNRRPPNLRYDGCSLSNLPPIFDRRCLLEKFRACRLAEQTFRSIPLRHIFANLQDSYKITKRFCSVEAAVFCIVDEITATINNLSTRPTSSKKSKGELVVVTSKKERVTLSGGVICEESPIRANSLRFR